MRTDYCKLKRHSRIHLPDPPFSKHERALCGVDLGGMRTWVEQPEVNAICWECVRLAHAGPDDPAWVEPLGRMFAIRFHGAICRCELRRFEADPIVAMLNGWIPLVGEFGAEADTIRFNYG